MYIEILVRFLINKQQWLHDKRTEGCSGAALAMAAGRGHLGTVQWFYSNGIPGDISKAIEKAQEGGHVEVRDMRGGRSVDTAVVCKDNERAAAAVRRDGEG